MPSEMTTSQCHRLQGRRSILVGMFVLTGFTSGPTLLLIVFIAPRLLYSSLCCSDYAHVFAHVFGIKVFLIFCPFLCSDVPTRSSFLHPRSIYRLSWSCQVFILSHLLFI